MTSPKHTIPMPTLYASEGYRKPKPSITELVLYNMSSMLASVAIGYDVRVSNVSPLHPKLQPMSMDNEYPNGDASQWIDANNLSRMDDDRSFFGHNTYHGATKHVR